MFIINSGSKTTSDDSLECTVVDDQYFLYIMLHDHYSGNKPGFCFHLLMHYGSLIP
jgi:hypothetical protein